MLTIGYMGRYCNCRIIFLLIIFDCIVGIFYLFSTKNFSNTRHVNFINPTLEIERNVTAYELDTSLSNKLSMDLSFARNAFLLLNQSTKLRSTSFTISKSNYRIFDKLPKWSVSKTSENGKRIALNWNQLNQSHDQLHSKDLNLSILHGDEHCPSHQVRPPQISFADVLKENPGLMVGGMHKPKKKGKGKVAIIVPYRNRLFHLRMLLHYIHPILQKQNLEYRIFVINQTQKGIFNKAKLLNIGYTEALKLDNYNCFVFHDVDLMPENNKCLYLCSEKNARHISVAVSKFRYRLGRGVTIGGVSCFTPEQLKAVNGWSNSFMGWGGEDDDMAKRLRAKGIKIARPSAAICRFTSLPHKRDEGNPLNKNRFNLLRHTILRMKTDGLNSLNYKLLDINAYATYTNISVDVTQV